MLNLRYTSVSVLPSSLHGTRTLRVLDLAGTGLGCPQRKDEGPENIGFSRIDDAGQEWFCMIGSPAFAAEIARRDDVLRPLSLAVPELRICMHDEPPTHEWWHAELGMDWWEAGAFF